MTRRKTNQTEWKSFSVEHEGKQCSGLYAVSSGQIIVSYAGERRAARSLGSLNTTIMVLVGEIEYALRQPKT